MRERVDEACKLRRERGFDGRVAAGGEEALDGRTEGRALAGVQLGSGGGVGGGGVLTAVAATELSVAVTVGGKVVVVFELDEGVFDRDVRLGRLLVLHRDVDCRRGGRQPGK